MKRPPVINAHTHLLCLEFIPNKMSRSSAKIPLAERVAGSFIVRKLAGAVKRRGAEFLGAFAEEIKCKDSEVKNCFKNFDLKSKKCKNCFGVVVDNFISEYGEYLTYRAAQDNKFTKKNKQIDIYVPLMMDLEWGANSSSDSFKGMMSYLHQIKFISEHIKRHPFKMFPFVMFDPRRGGILNCKHKGYDCYKRCDNYNCGYNTCIDALENKGFLGIKMYPPMGYFPNSVNYDRLNSKSLFYNEFKRNKLREMTIGKREDKLLKEMDERLDKLYKYCSANCIPITTHAGASGAYDIDMTQGQANIFANIDNWEEVLNNHNALKLNFAHFGGNYIEGGNSPVMEQAIIWRKKIINLLLSYKNTYADISYHDMGLETNSFGEKKYHKDQVEVEKYFFDLKELLSDKELSKKILFGTDTPMLSHTWSENDYITHFKKFLSEKQFEQIATVNPIKFLFENKQIPERYTKLIHQDNSEALNKNNLPAWVEGPDEDAIEVNLDKYIIV